MVRTIGNDLHMDYSAVGQTTHLAARMEQLATPGTIRLLAATLRLVEGLVHVNALGQFPVKGLADPVEVFELVGVSTVRRRLQAIAALGLTQPSGGRRSWSSYSRCRSEPGHGVRPGRGGRRGGGCGEVTPGLRVPPRHRTQGHSARECLGVVWQGDALLSVIDLLKRYSHVEDRDDIRTIRAKLTGQVLTLDAALQDVILPLLALLDALPEDSLFLTLDPPQGASARWTPSSACSCVRSREQPLLLVFEDLTTDSRRQLLGSLAESPPTTRLLLLINYRPEYHHSWGSKEYYTQLRSTCWSQQAPRKSCRHCLETIPA